MKKAKIGVMGTRRGAFVWQYCKESDNGEVVAICDKLETALDKVKETLDDDTITYYTDYNEFIKHDMDIVILVNYANEHAPFAIKAMEAGKNVISEVLPVQCMAEAVELIECIERTGKRYCYAENYCYMGAPFEMKQKLLMGELGEFEYGEGEYLHNCESWWPSIAYGDKNHWRNRMSAFFYCTHSVGPLLHIAGMRPVKVTGFECPFNARMARMGAAAGHTAIEMVTLENGAHIKSIHGVGCSKNSIWYSIYGSKGRMESAREDTEQGGVSKIYTNLDSVEGANENNIQSYVPTPENNEIAEKYGHGGSDYFCLKYAIDYIMGDDSSDHIDIYEALDMWMCGFFGYLSVLGGGIPMNIPDLHCIEAREKYRNDFRCTDPKVAGDQLLPSYSKGEPDIPDEVYEIQRNKLENK